MRCNLAPHIATLPHLQESMNSPITKAKTDEATRLLEGLEIMRDELGPLAEELIALLRENGVTPEINHDRRTRKGHVGRIH